MHFSLPGGFRFAGIHAGIKQNAEAEDLTLIACDPQATAAGVYTTNVVYAAPVQWDRQLTPLADCRGVIVNSGNANACTGKQGLEDAEAMARLAAAALGCRSEQILVMSTGVIGHFLPMDRLRDQIPVVARKLDATVKAFEAAARGILTTDNGLKIGSRIVNLSRGPACLAGMAKGAGMIGPQMATMLAVVMTDAPLSAHRADVLLRAAADRSFNCISVEGHMSTNDTLLLLAAAPTAERRALAGSDEEAFGEALGELCIELARKIPDDGEGSTHLITIRVRGARTIEDARLIARNIASSALVKTAIAGGDPNWGRIVSAAGYAGPRFDPHKVSLSINGLEIYRDGAPRKFDAGEVSRSIKAHRETLLDLTLGEGDQQAVFWTSDLTVDYVHFNADYHT